MAHAINRRWILCHSSHAVILSTIVYYSIRITCVALSICIPSYLPRGVYENMLYKIHHTRRYWYQPTPSLKPIYQPKENVTINRMRGVRAQDMCWMWCCSVSCKVDVEKRNELEQLKKQIASHPIHYTLFHHTQTK